MNEKLPLIHFSNVFDAVFPEFDRAYEKFSPSILFLVEKNGEIRSNCELGNVPGEMTEFYRQFATYFDGKLSDSSIYLTLTVDISISCNNEIWNGLLGIVIDKQKYKLVQVQPYLEGLKQTFMIASRMVETDKTLSLISTENKVYLKMSEILNKTNYSEDAESFSEAFVETMREYVVGGEMTLFLKDQLRSSFTPSASTDSLIVENKNKYLVEDKEINDLLKIMSKKKSNLIKKDDIEKTLFTNLIEFDDYFVIPIYRGEDCVALVIPMSRNGSCKIRSIEEVVSLAGSLGPWIKKVLEYEEMQLEKVRKNLLLKVNRKFYSTMDVNSILEEILHALHEAYPSFGVNLLLSHDWEVADYLPVQPLEIADSEEDPGTKAYLTGQVQVIDIVESHKTVLFVPLKGKQGVYGIFEMITETYQIFPKNELDFIEILASTGGNAIENAELYQQSRQYIQDLQLINQTSHQLNANLKLEEAIDFMICQMKEAFSADKVGFIMLDHRWSINNESMIWCESSFSEEKNEQFINGLITRMKEEKEEIFLGDWSREDINAPFQSVMGVPMIHNDLVIGAVLVFGSDSYAFSFDAFKLCQSLVHHSSLALVNAILHEEMKQLVVTDYLTKLFSREYMDEKVAESMNDDGYGSFILLDVDCFKKVNDLYGHETGDSVLIQIAEIMRRNTKRDKDIAVRWGGEELAVYLPKTECKDAMKVAERIRENVEKDTDPNVTVSCGVSEWSHIEGAPSLTKLFSDADNAMYTVKNSGRNQIISYKESAKISF